MVQGKDIGDGVFFFVEDMGTGTEEAQRRIALQAFYGSTAWKNTRDAYRRKARGLCEECLARGEIKAGEIVHHVIPLSPANVNEYNVALSFSNLRLVCAECHARIHAERGDETRAGRKKGKPQGSRRKRRYRIDEKTGAVVLISPPSSEK